MKFFILFIHVIAISSLLQAADYRTDTPDGLSLPVDPFITENITGPVLTTDWCANIAFDTNSNNMFAHPLALDCNKDGIQLGHPNSAFVDENYYLYPFHKDVTVRTPGLADEQTLMDAYSDWAVTASWDEGNFKATMAHGSPFAYFETATTIEIEISGTPSVWYNENGVIGLTMGDRHYGIFAPSGASWTIDDALLTSDLDSKGYVSIATLPDNTDATLEYFTTFAYSYIADTKVSWEYDEAASVVNATYEITIDNKEGDNTNMLYALYPHQWLNYTGPLTSYSYPSVAGEMKVVEGASFTTSTPFTGILPNLPMMADSSDIYNKATLQAFIDTEEAKSVNTLVREDGDTYWTGKELNRTAQLIRIAEQLGDTTARDYFLDVIKAKMEGWLTYTEGESAEYFYYHEAWGTLVGVNASYGSSSNLNDHHFHYGYFVYTAATIAQYDKEWAETWEDQVELIIRDCNSPDRDDDMFPFMRAFDIYAGHSWASGDAAFASGNNQESTSEAMNFAAGTALWGIATGDDVMRDLGVFLYATEQQALLNYWFDINEIVFPEDFDHTMVGMIWGEKADYATWFSGEPECIHGINMLPMTASSLYLGHNPDYIKENYAEIEENNGGIVDNWKDVMWEFYVLGDPDAAMAEYTADPDYTVEEGETKAHTYHWMHNIYAAGTVIGDVTADIATYAVFEKDGARTYTAYNYSDTERYVTFSDGAVILVPANTLIATPDTANITVPEVPDTTVIDPEVPDTTDVDEGETSIKNGARTLEYLVFPNPTIDIINVSYKAKNDAPIDFKLYTTYGECVYSYSITHSEPGNYVHTIENNQLEAGVYFVECTIDGSKSRFPVTIVNQ